MAKYDIRIKSSAVKELKKFPSADIRRILSAIDALADNPRPAGSQKLSGMEYYRIRCGVYRVVYEIQDSVLLVMIIKIGQRKDVHRRG